MIVGLLGGGQLGRMLALAGVPLGMRFRSLDPVSDAPAADVADHQRASLDDPAALRAFAGSVDVVTYETENVPPASVRMLAERVPVLPGLTSLAATADRLAEKRLLSELGIPTPRFERADSLPLLVNALRAVGLPAVVKTRTQGYDGRGVAIARSVEDARGIWHRFGGAPVIAESLVPFDRELSVIGVRDREGRTAIYPLVENFHEDGILRVSRAPAPGADGSLTATAQAYVHAIMDALGHVGVLTLEMFDLGGMLVANEIAPRVHNSGHWTIEGARTSQFENHLRAICGLPLGPTDAVGHAAMVNLIGETVRPDLLDPALGRLHLYGKRPRPGRKVGHITVVAPRGEERDLSVNLLLDSIGASDRWNDPGSGDTVPSVGVLAR